MRTVQLMTPLVGLVALTACHGEPDFGNCVDNPAACTSEADTDTDTDADTDTDTDADKSLLQFDGDRPHNLLVVSFDTLRRDRIGFWRGTSDTEFLDARLGEAVVLDDARSCTNWTYASFLCMMSGQSMVDLEFEPISNDADAPGLPSQLDLMPLWLQQAGLQTAVVSGSPYLNKEPGILTGEGLDSAVYDDWGSSADFPGADWILANAPEKAAELVADGRPWYLQIHYMDPHTPFKAPDAYTGALDALDPIPYDLRDPIELGEAQVDFPRMTPEEQALVVAHVEAEYAADLHYMDDQFALLWQALETAGALDDTLVVFWSDHGEQFWEHFSFGHSQGMYQEENRVLMAFWAQNLPAARLDVPALHQDLMPTVFPILGVPDQTTWTGQALHALASDRTRIGFRYSSPSPARAMATSEGKVLTYSSNGRKAFYDASTDPGELVDLYDAADPQVIALWEDLSAELDRINGYIPHLVFQDSGP